MSAKAVEQSIKQLVAQGYSKSKAQKALKECGNNAVQARKWLEANKADEEKKAHEAELAAKAKANAERLKKEEKERREREAIEGPPPDVTPFTKKHPCISQYGSCRYGASCMYRELPADTCINYLVGNCLFGDQCRNRHAINGVDIRKMMFPDADDEHEYVPDGNGNYVQVKRGGGKVQEGELWVPEHSPEMAPAPLPDPSAFQTDDASMPTYSEPLQPQQRGGHHHQQQHDIWNTSSGSGGPGGGGFIPNPNGGDGSGVVGYRLQPNAVTPSGSPTGPAPTPFLQKARIGQHVAQPLPKPLTPQQNAAPAPQPRQSSGGLASQRHPCIAQMGECRFGNQCMHADFRGDVCVHWLNGRCRNASSEQCRYLHESVLFGREPTSRQTHSSANAGGSGGQHNGGQSLTSIPGSTPPTSPPAAGMFGSANESIWGAMPPPFGSQQLGPTMAGGAGQRSFGGEEDPWARMYEAPSREETARRTGEFVAQQMALDVALRESQAPSTPDTGKWRGPPSAIMQKPAQAAKPSNATPVQADSAEEARAFEALIEVFPHVDPSLILQALRRCGNDRKLVADIIADTTPEHAERVLYEAMDEQVNTALSLKLVTLHSLMPSMEPASLAKILEDCNGDFDEAVRVAATTTENLVGSDIANQWGSGQTKDANTGRTTNYTPGDQMKLERLQGMFRELERFVIENAFERANRNTTDAVAVLNSLHRDLKLVAHETREEWGRQATTRAVGSEAQRHQKQQQLAKKAAAKKAKPAQDVGGFTVTACDDEGAPATSPVAAESPDAAGMSRSELYNETREEAAAHRDWRRTRQEAYMVNTARAQLVGLAVNAYSRHQHDVGKNLLRRAQELKRRYERLNMLAMHALERERSEQNGVSLLDLHGFHADEAMDVVHRRVELCCRKRVSKLRIIVGHGSHSKGGKSVIYPQVLAQLRAHPSVAVKSVLPAEIVVNVHLTH